jgi:hypothetical protein
MQLTLQNRNRETPFVCNVLLCVTHVWSQKLN